MALNTFLKTLVVVYLVLMTEQPAFISANKGSCMTRWLKLAGVDDVRLAMKYAERLKLFKLDEGTFDGYSPQLYTFMFDENSTASTTFLRCLRNETEVCASSRACQNGGICLFDERSASFVCSCAVGYEGKYCQIEKDGCKRKPCKNGGHCTNRLGNFTCTCAAGFEGRTCEKVWFHPRVYKHIPAKINKTQHHGRKLALRVEALEQQLAASQRQIAASQRKIVALQERCTGVAGYAMKVFPPKYVEKDVAKLGELTFTKKRVDTLIRLMWNSNIRNSKAHSCSRWYLLIDGKPCSNPQPIITALYTSQAVNIHRRSTLIGFCRATSSGAIGNGTHTVTVHTVSGGAGCHGHPPGNGYSLWGTASVLQVDEYCPQ